MADRFIKFIPSQEADYLQEFHPNAFLLLCLIAKRARRIAGYPDGLEIGEAHIGDYKKAGIASERQYRTAKSILSQRGHLLFIETCRNRKKATTGKTTVGTKVKLLKSDIWDINLEYKDDRKDDRPTTDRRPTDDEQERIKKVKKEKEHPLTPMGGSAEFFSIHPDLAKIKDSFLSSHQKRVLTETYPADRIASAMAYARSLDESDVKSLFGLIRWHCEQSQVVKPKLSDDEVFVENKTFASQFLENQSSTCKYVVGPTYCEISFFANREPLIFEYQHEEPEKFAKTLLCALRTYRLEKIDPVGAEAGRSC